MKELANFNPFMSSYRDSEGHVLAPGLAIGSLALVLAAGFGYTGILDRADGGIAKILHVGSGAVIHLPEWIVWSAAAAGAFSLSFLMLSVPGAWRRVVLWVSALVLIAGWGPVLVLAARPPVIAAPLLATFWAGLCAFIYASRHRMAADRAS